MGEATWGRLHGGCRQVEPCASFESGQVAHCVSLEGLQAAYSYFILSSGQPHSKEDI